MFANLFLFSYKSLRFEVRLSIQNFHVPALCLVLPESGGCNLKTRETGKFSEAIERTSEVRAFTCHRKGDKWITLLNTLCHVEVSSKMGGRIGGSSPTGKRMTARLASGTTRLVNGMETPTTKVSRPLKTTGSTPFQRSTPSSATRTRPWCCSSR